MEYRWSDLQPLIRIEADLIRVIRRKKEGYKNTFTTVDGKRLSFKEIITQPTNPHERIIGGIYLSYSPNSFLSVDRVIHDPAYNRFKRQRRIINYLQSRSGQIGSAVLIELLKIENGREFSKHALIPTIDQVFFANQAISSGEINESISRMFRKTMAHFFGIEGKRFIRRNFLVGIQQLPHNENYNFVKPRIDRSVQNFIHNLRQKVR